MAIDWDAQTIAKGDKAEIKGSDGLYPILGINWGNSKIKLETWWNKRGAWIRFDEVKRIVSPM
jgi:hypothetical protein